MNKINDFSYYSLFGTLTKEPKIIHREKSTIAKISIKTEKIYKGKITSQEIGLICFDDETEIVKKIQEELHTGMQASFTGSIGGKKADYKNKNGEDIFYISLYIKTFMIGADKPVSFENDNPFEDIKEDPSELEDIPF